MMTDWQTFLNNNTSISNSDAAKDLAKNIMLDLSHLGLIKLSGEDAFSFLQGQVTNDVNQLKNNSHYSGYCTAKGRLLALFFAFSLGEDIYLQLPQALLPSIMKRLKMYVLRSKVIITDASDEWVRIGVSGENIPAALAEHFEQIPTADYQVISQESGHIIKLPSSLPRYQILTLPSIAPALWTKLSTSCQEASKEVWDLIEIQAGIPEINTGTQEAFVPQMINLDALGGINFKKGCYTGQEIVARTHYLGKVKRRTQIAHLSADNTPQAGDVVTGQDGQEAGQIVRVAPATNGGFDILVEVRLESLEAGAITWQGQVLSIQSLPYAL